MKTIWTKYRVEFGMTDNKKGVYVGDTVEELHESIDSDKRLEAYKDIRYMLKYGYFNEFRNKPYETKDYVIDNCMHFMWTVKE
ncbi:hypothetical protein [Bacillus phage vB_BanS-Thrax2]|nr:hypothetical protein [Bacillus phage vB_BanS-Thrax2]